jgi:hypothetical protein
MGGDDSVPGRELRGGRLKRINDGRIDNPTLGHPVSWMAPQPPHSPAPLRSWPSWGLPVGEDKGCLLSIRTESPGCHLESGGPGRFACPFAAPGAGTRARREPAGGARGRPIYGRPPGGAASGALRGPPWYSYSILHRQSDEARQAGQAALPGALRVTSACDRTYALLRYFIAMFGVCGAALAACFHGGP